MRKTDVTEYVITSENLTKNLKDISLHCLRIYMLTVME